MRSLYSALLMLLLTPIAALAQISGTSPGGQGVPAYGMYCMNSSGQAVVCSFGGGGGGGAVTESGTWQQYLDYNAAIVSPTNPLGISDLALDALISGGKLPVSIAAMPTTPVTGTFWQATQPISGTVADSTLAAALEAQGSTTSGQNGPLTQIAVSNAASAFTTGTTQPPQETTQGLLKVTFSLANTASGFTAPSSAASTAIAPLAFGGYNSTPYALTTGQDAPPALTTTAQISVDDESLKAGYATASFSSSIAATPSDEWGICGSSTKTVRLKHLHVTASATTAGAMQMQLIIRTTADTAGTSTAITFGKLNTASAYAAASETGVLYTANPTVGTLATVADQALLDFGLTASGPAYDETFGKANTPAIVLSGTANCVYLNLSGGTVPAGAQLSISAQTTEE